MKAYFKIQFSCSLSLFRLLYHKIPYIGWLKQQTFIFHSTQSWEVQDPGAGRVSVRWEPLPGLWTAYRPVPSGLLNRSPPPRALSLPGTPQSPGHPQVSEALRRASSGKGALKGWCVLGEHCGRIRTVSPQLACGLLTAWRVLLKYRFPDHAPWIFKLGTSGVEP